MLTVTILHWRNKTKEKIKKKLSSVLLPLLVCFHSAYTLLNPGLFYLIPSLKLGAVEHLENLAVCSQVRWAAWRKVRVFSSCPQGVIHLHYNTTPAKIILSENIICFRWRSVSTKSVYRENTQRLGQEKKRVLQSETQSSVGLRQKRRQRISILMYNVTIDFHA